MRTKTMFVSVLIAGLVAFTSNLGWAGEAKEAAAPAETPKKESSVDSGIMPKAAANPFKNANVGDWMEYAMTAEMTGSAGGGMKMPKMESTVKQTVTAKDDTSITLRIETSMMGTPMSREQKIPLDKPFEPYLMGLKDATATPLGEGDETINVGRKPYACHWVKVKVVATKPVPSESTTKAWTCKDVPMSGLVKMESDSTINMEGQTMVNKMTMELTGSGKK
jgi:hypothetical protein